MVTISSIGVVAYRRATWRQHGNIEMPTQLSIDKCWFEVGIEAEAFGGIGGKFLYYRKCTL